LRMTVTKPQSLPAYMKRMRDVRFRTSFHAIRIGDSLSCLRPDVGAAQTNLADWLGHLDLGLGSKKKLRDIMHLLNPWGGNQSLQPLPSKESPRSRAARSEMSLNSARIIGQQVCSVNFRSLLVWCSFNADAQLCVSHALASYTLPPPQELP
jgi:hypothetical protein